MIMATMKDIETLITELGSLPSCDEAARELIALGEVSIEPLRRFLLDGKPEIAFQPRQCAVQALATLGAREVLIEYLRQKRDIPDLTKRMAEEAVEISAARALKAWPSDKVAKFLLEMAAIRLQPGVIEALGEMQRIEAIPYFIRALEDDVCRRAAEEALRNLGVQSRDALAEAAVARAPTTENESPSSLLRRRSALGLLNGKLLPRRYWRNLKPCLWENHTDIVLAAARIAVTLGSISDKADAISRLASLLPSAKDSIQSGEIEDCIRTLLAAGASLLSRKGRSG